MYVIVYCSVLVSRSDICAFGFVHFLLIVPTWGPGHPANIGVQGRVHCQDRLSGPVEIGIDPFKDRSSEEYVHPGVQDLVKWGKA